MKNQSNHYKLIILGSGPAGLTAAIYASRANLNPLVISGLNQGGQLMITTEVENYPGFPSGIKGPEMMDLFKKQAENLGTDFITGDVTSTDLSHRPFIIKKESEVFTCDSLIIATGASARWLNIESEKKYLNRGVSACATCDGFFYRGKDVAVVGGGDTAMEESLYLSNICSNVYVIHRRNELRASKILQDRCFQRKNMHFIWDSVVEEILGNDMQGMNGLKVRNVKTNEISEYPFTGIFVAIGHHPNTDLFKGQLDLDENGYIVTKTGSTYTLVEGAFACGDVQDSVYRQAVTAAGTGCMAAIDAERWLVKKGLV